MKVKKAVISAAGPHQRALPIQRIVDSDGGEKSVLSVLVEKALIGDVEAVGVVVCPGDEERYREALGKQRTNARFIPQPRGLGYGYSVYCAREFVRGDAFLHMVSDHLYVSSEKAGTAGKLIEVAEATDSPVSAVQPTREHYLSRYGTIGARRIPDRKQVYRIETVIEKPTPTEAEQHLYIPGMRAGYYLSFFGMHVLTPLVLEILGEIHSNSPDQPFALTAALAELARRAQYLAWETSDRRYDIGEPYGILMAQLALALNGRDRNNVLSRLLELLADREMAATASEER